MARTSLGGVSNSASKQYSNARGTISLVNYGKITGSADNYQLAQAAKDALSQPTQTVNLPVTNNTPCNDVYGGCYKTNIIW
jgi:hypothetical protein